MKSEFYKTFNFLFGTTVLAAVAVLFVIFTFERPPTTEVQMGFRGTAMELVYNERALERLVASNVLPPAPEPADPDGPRASEVFENVQVLGHLSVEQFNRIMQAMTEWIYPNPQNPAEGCNACHVPGNFAAEDIYTKHVARRMLQMTYAINSTHASHVGQVGVTCYTCHRGQAVPAAVWSAAVPNAAPSRTWQVAGEQNRPVAATGFSTLPSDPFSPYLLRNEPIRHISGAARARDADNNASIIQSEWVYGLMMHLSTSLGVNCTFCHNTRSFASWETSTPQRVTAWHGLAMVRDINNTYIEPLRDRFPPNRLGPMGDPLKVNCATCHQGAHKPLLGQNMLRDFPELNPPPRRAEAAATPARN